MFQVYQLDSEDVVFTESKTYEYENDSLKVIYDFWGKRGVMRFAIQNKSETPFYINWDQSKFIRNGKLFPYWSDKSMVETRLVRRNLTNQSHFFSDKSLGYGGFGFELNTASGSAVSIISKEVKQSIVPPGSWIEKADYYLIKDPETQIRAQIREVRKSRFPKNDKRDLVKQIVETDKEYLSLDSLKFPKDSTLSIRNYLSISDSPEATGTFLDNTFRLSKVTNHKISQKDALAMESQTHSRESKFFTIRNPSLNSFDISVGGVAGIGRNCIYLSLGYERRLNRFLELGAHYQFNYSFGSYNFFDYGYQQFRIYYITGRYSHSFGTALNFICNPISKHQFGIRLVIQGRYLPREENVHKGVSQTPIRSRFFLDESLELNCDFESTSGFSIMPFFAFGAYYYPGNTNLQDLSENQFPASGSSDIWRVGFNFSGGVRFRIHW